MIPSTDTPFTEAGNMPAKMKQWSKRFSVMVLLLGISVLLGWWLDIEFLKRILPGTVAMNPATALCFIFCALSLLLTNTRWQKAAYIFAIAVVIAAGIKLVTLVLGLPAYIDTFLFSEKIKNEILGNISNSMAPNTAAGFMQAGLALLFLLYHYKRKKNYGQWLAVLLFFLSFLALTGYLYKENGLCVVFACIPMALPTSIGFLILSLALLCATPETGLMKILSSPYRGSRIALLLLPVSVLMPVVLSTLFEHSGFFSAEIGMILHETSVMLIFISTILFVSFRLNRESVITQQARAELLALNNVLEQKVNERTEKLKNSLQEVSDYKYAINQSSIVNITDDEGKIIFANENFCKLSQYTKEELIGQDSRIMNSGFHPKSFFTELWTTIISGKIWRAEVKNKAKDGSFFWVNTVIIPSLDANRKPYQYMVFREDITERKNAEEKILASEVRYRRLFEAAKDGILILDAETGLIEDVNPYLEKKLGFFHSEFLGKQLWEIGLFKDITENKTAFVKLKKEGYIRYEDLPLKTKEGPPLWVEFVSNVYEVSGKHVIQCNIRDITDRKKAENEREKLLKDLSDKFNELMQFNYIVSHNLRVPVANLLGLSHLLTLHGTSDDDKLKIIEHIRTSAKKMEELTVDLNLVLSNKSAINTHKENIIISDLIHSIFSSLEQQINESECVIKTNISEDAARLFTVKSYFESIFYNLINNAIKYRASNRKPQIIISVKKANNNFIISVTDNGIGIDLEKYGDQIFGLYKRFHLEREGKGLGLHMTRTQAVALGGKISVESEVNKGTTFTVSLPV